MAVLTAIKVPESLKTEHDELHQELLKGTQEPGLVGETARAVARVLHEHFEKEEEFAMPPLAVLRSAAEGKPVPDEDKILEMTAKLKGELNHMLEEHKKIILELDGLSGAARIEKKPEYAIFAERLKLHAQTEEEVLYPASILIGEYLKLKSGK